MSQDNKVQPRPDSGNGRSPMDEAPQSSLADVPDCGSTESANPDATLPTSILTGGDPTALANYLLQGHLLVVNKRQRNGLLIVKGFYAEFAGPGAIVGGNFDRDCRRVIPVGDLCLAPPSNHDECQEAYLIRRQWIRLTQQFTDSSGPAVGRARMILNQFETYFDARAVQKLPDEAFALLVGVFPHTVRLARRPAGKLNVKK
ncbi:MAG: hypothetical protein AAFY26_06340 [Cyanobacteria bacterium J06638_22]